jgi:hypothetical protein
MTRKTRDPKLIELLDRVSRAHQDCERWYARLKRAFNALEKARARLRRLEKQVEKHEQTKETP